MKNLSFFCALFMLISCDNSNPEGNNTNMDSGIEFSIFNSKKEDLLDPKNPNGLAESNIKIFYVVNGEKKEVYMPNLTYPRSFRIFKHENEYRIAVFLNDTEKTDKTITYIQWNTKDIDTIEATFDRSGGSVLKNKLWLNGDQVWERGDNTIDAYISLTK